MRVGEVDGQFKIGCDLFVQSHLPAAIIGQGLAQGFWHGLHLAYKAAMHRGGFRIVKPDENKITRRAFDQRADGGAVVFALDEITLPVAGNGAHLDFLWPFGDRRDVLQLSAPVLAARAGAAGLARLAQKLDEFCAQATARIGIDVCVDRFVADALLRIVRIHDLQLASALLRRPVGTLGNRLSNLGRREEALAASQEAVDIYRRLAQTRPDAFLPDLASSLNNSGA